MFRANQAVAFTQKTQLISSYFPIEIVGTNHPAARQGRVGCLSLTYEKAAGPQHSSLAAAHLLDNNYWNANSRFVI